MYTHYRLTFYNGLTQVNIPLVALLGSTPLACSHGTATTPYPSAYTDKHSLCHVHTEYPTGGSVHFQFSLSQFTTGLTYQGVTRTPHGHHLHFTVTILDRFLSPPPLTTSLPSAPLIIITITATRGVRHCSTWVVAVDEECAAVHGVRSPLPAVIKYELDGVEDVSQRDSPAVSLVGVYSRVYWAYSTETYPMVAIRAEAVCGVLLSAKGGRL